MAFYDFIISKGSDQVQNNKAFMRKQLTLSSIQEEFELFKQCISDFLKYTKEDFEEEVRLILSKIVNTSIAMDSETAFRFVSESIAALRIYSWDVYLIKRMDMIENLLLEDGITISYLLDEKSSPIFNICEGIGVEFDEEVRVMTSSDATMMWFNNGTIKLENDIEGFIYLESKLDDFKNLQKRGQSLDYPFDPFYSMLRQLGNKPILITNVMPYEYDYINNQKINDEVINE